ncbi:acyl-CoA thioesterase [Sphingomonas chungangi]|uniref:acyl-CoA thioesterase n=1 Tax=Sphingomonas chungangi TaxID=2683589 RepID=UPI001FE620B4|nr:acyl-CoA thioesterase domain-containing protein [Sphingomonas chungangi]
MVRKPPDLHSILRVLAEPRPPLPVGESWFVGCQNQGNAYGTLFGGQLLGQAVLAASETVPDRLIHSVHAYFLAPGVIDRPVRYQVENGREGRSFAHRRVTASQDTAIFSMNCSFRSAEIGWQHQTPMPDVPPPEDLEEITAIVARRDPGLLDQWISHFAGNNPIDLRPVRSDLALERQSTTRRQTWVRIPLLSGTDDQAIHRAGLAWLSDYWVSSAGLVLHRHPLPGPDVLLASIDHALWIHRPVRVDDWLLFDADSPVAQDGTALVRGQIYDRSGALIANVAQELLQRLR